MRLSEGGQCRRLYPGENAVRQKKIVPESRVVKHVGLSQWEEEGSVGNVLHVCAEYKDVCLRVLGTKQVNFTSQEKLMWSVQRACCPQLKRGRRSEKMVIGTAEEAGDRVGG